MHALDVFAHTLLLRLGWSSLQAVVLIALLAGLMRLLPRVPAALRCTLWWLVGLQLMVGLAWHAPVQLPWLSAPAITRVTDAAVIAPSVSANARRKQAIVLQASTAEAVPQVAAASHAQPMRWPLLLGLLWLTGLALQLPRDIRHALRARRLVRESEPLMDSGLQAQCSAMGAEFGLRRSPRLRISNAVTSPQVIGLRRPTILLPGRQVLAPEEASLALAHELAHLRRGDLWLGWIPALAQRLFFFHPLVAWAMREYALSRESACDAQVLAQPGSEPQRYGHLLLRLGVAQPLHPGLAGAAPSFRQLKRRLTMLQQTAIVPGQRRNGWLLVALIAMAGVLPYRLTATTATQPATPASVHSIASTPTADASTSPHVLLPTPPPPPAPPIPPAPPGASAPPAPLAPPAPPAPPTPPNISAFGAHHVSIDTSSEARDGFALIDDDTVMISGTPADVAAAKRLHRNNASMLWFRRGNQSWLIRDPATLQRARTIYQPLTDLANQQGRLAGRMGELAGRQAGLAARNGAFAREQAVFARQQAQLAGQAAREGDTAAIAARRQRLEAAQADMEQRQQVAQQKLETQQHNLEAKQAELEAQQTAMEQHRQRASAQANRDMRELLDDALAKDLAKPTSRS